MTPATQASLTAGLISALTPTPDNPNSLGDVRAWKLARGDDADSVNLFTWEMNQMVYGRNSRVGATMRHLRLNLRHAIRNRWSADRIAAARFFLAELEAFDAAHRRAEAA